MLVGKALGKLSASRVRFRCNAFRVVRGTLNVYTDASIVGEKMPDYYVQKRRRNGSDFISWVGWHGCDYPDAPTLAGQACVGPQVTQRAEFHAALHGLEAAGLYVATRGPMYISALARQHAGGG